VWLLVAVAHERAATEESRLKPLQNVQTEPMFSDPFHNDQRLH